MGKPNKKKVIDRAIRNAESKKLYSFRLKEGLVKKLEKDAQDQNLSVTGLLEALIQVYLSEP